MNSLTLSEYQLLALRTAPPFKTKMIEPIQGFLLHGVLGLSTEIAEIVEDSSNLENVLQEIGDVMWYCNLICSGLGVDLFNLGSYEVNPQSLLTDLVSYMGTACDCIKRHLYYSVPLDEDRLIQSIAKIQSIMKSLSGGRLEECLFMNIEKLKVRYPEKFDAEKANARNLDAEKKIFNQHK